MKQEAKTKQDVVSQFRCAGILAAARKVFANKGFTAATMDEIADAAGLAKGTLYLYFPSKRDIYLAAFREGVEELAAASRDAVAAAPTMREKLLAYIGTRLRYVEEHRDFYKIYHAEFGNLTQPATVSNWFAVLYREQLELLAGMLKQAMENGEVRPVPAQPTASVIYGVVKELMLRRILGWSAVPVEQDVEALCEILWNGIGKS